MLSNLYDKEFEIIEQSLKELLGRLGNKKILITGANGLIGSYLIYFLDYINTKHNLDLEIFASSRSRNKLVKLFENKNIKIIEQDLQEPLNQYHQVDFIIHLASNAHPLAYSKAPVGTMKANLLGTISLLDMIKDAKTKFLYISTGEIYGNNIDRPFVETDLGYIDTKSVRSCYPESKRAAETLCMAYKEQYNTDVNIARLCYIYGPTITDDNSRADAQFLRNAINGEDIVLKSQGLQKRTYCYVADCVSALLTILLKAPSGEVYNIANPNSIVSVREYAQTLADIANVALKFDMPDEIESKGYSKQADSILNSQKLIDLGWNSYFDIKEGLKLTVEDSLKRKSYD